MLKDVKTVKDAEEALFSSLLQENPDRIDDYLKELKIEKNFLHNDFLRLKEGCIKDARLPITIKITS